MHLTESSKLYHLTSRLFDNNSCCFRDLPIGGRQVIIDTCMSIEAAGVGGDPQPHTGPRGVLSTELGFRASNAERYAVIPRTATTFGCRSVTSRFNRSAPATNSSRVVAHLPAGPGADVATNALLVSSARSDLL